MVVGRKKLTPLGRLAYGLKLSTQLKLNFLKNGQLKCNFLHMCLALNFDCPVGTRPALRKEKKISTILGIYC